MEDIGNLTLYHATEMRCQRTSRQGPMNFCTLGAKNASYSEGITRPLKHSKGPYKKLSILLTWNKKIDLAKFIIYSETITRPRICQNYAVFICYCHFSCI
jgi:hypothetical protein